MNHIMLFTDGSVDPDSGSGYGAYLAFEDSGQSIESLEPLVKHRVFDRTSSTRLELQILLHALGELQGNRGRITVYTDSQNVVGLRDRRARLEESGYLSGRGQLLNNHDLYREFFGRIDGLDCEIIKVRGHRASAQKGYAERVFTLVDRASRSALRGAKQSENHIAELVDDFIAMNQAGLVLELCQKHYAEDVVMLNNGEVFAESMREAHDKQKGFVDAVSDFDVRLISRGIEGDVSELVFAYKITTEDGEVNEFTGKHVLIWGDGKIVREEFESVD
jgi:ribonuclease HI